MTKRIHVIVRISDRCNQDCTYCYVDRDTRLRSKLRLDHESFRALYSLVLSSGLYDFINFIWHGGEPTLVGHEFLDEVIRLQSQYKLPSQEVENAIQTNATIITPEIVDVLVRHGVNVGVSVDAPPEVNDQFRVFWDGKPTLKRVLAGVEMMRSRGLQPGAICVLTKANYTKAKEIYTFFKNEGMSYQYNPMYADEGVCISTASQLAVTPEEYARTLLETYDLYLSDPNPTIDVTDLQHIVASMMAGCSQNCLYSGRCEEFIGVLPNGDVYLCDLFYKPDQKIGDLRFLKPEQLAHSPVLVKISTRPQQLFLGECRGCEWWTVCRGGCASKARAIFGDAMRKDPFCETRKLLFSHVRSTLLGKEVMCGETTARADRTAAGEPTSHAQASVPHGAQAG